MEEEQVKPLRDEDEHETGHAENPADAEYAAFVADKKKAEAEKLALKNQQEDADFVAWRAEKMRQRADAEERAAEEERKKDPHYRMGQIEHDMRALKSRLGFH